MVPHFNKETIMAKTKPRYKLSHRPKSYWEHSDPLQAILAGISGTARRQMITEAWNSGNFEQIGPELLRDDLDEGLRQYMGAAHPRFMGGEYLPKRLPGETAIVTIRLQSTTFDVIELRARPLDGGKIGLRWVDEYDCLFTAPADTISRPFSFGELILYIQQTTFGDEGYLPNVYNRMNITVMGWTSEYVEDYRYFTSFSSDFYPELETWAQDSIDAELDEVLAELAEE